MFRSHCFRQWEHFCRRTSDARSSSSNASDKGKFKGLFPVGEVCNPNVR